MIWNKKEMRDNPPPQLFDMNDNKCPLCHTRINVDKERWKKDSSFSCIRHNNYFYYCHKECFILLYDCVKRNVEKYSDEALVYMI